MAVKQSLPVSVVIANHNGGEDLVRTLRSLLDQEAAPNEIIVSDDGSTDGSDREVERCFPGVTVVRMERNTRRVNLVRNAGIRVARERYVLVTDNDIEFRSDALIRLWEVLRSDERVAVVTPRLMYMEERNRLYSGASRLHFLASSISDDRGGEVVGGSDPVPTVGGGIALVDRARVGEGDAFDSDYWIGWGDDGELYHRMRSMGHACLFVPRAVGYHRAKRWGSEFRVAEQVRNRWDFLFTYYATRSLVLLSPALFLYEALLASFLALKGRGNDWWIGTAAAWRERRRIAEKRGRAQSARRVPDRDLFERGEIYIQPALLKKPAWRFAARFVNGLFNGYYRFVRPCL